jgi:hypothetical protein
MALRKESVVRSIGVAVSAALIIAFVIPTNLMAAGTLTSVSWTVSNTATSATNITYAFSFKTATAGTIGKITMTVPSGTLPTGTLTLSHNFGIGGGTASLAAGSPATITYTVTSPVSVAAGIPIYLEFTGMTNTATAGSSTSTVNTQTSTSTNIDTGTSNSNTFSSGGVTTTIIVARSTVFSIDTNAIQIEVDPSVSTLATQAINLGVSSNAKNGYTLQCKVDKQPTGTNNASATLAAVTTGMASAAAWPGTPGKFGYSLGITNNGAAGSPAQGGTLNVGNNFAGFTVAGENCGAATGSTGNPLGSNLSNCGNGLCASAAHAWLVNVQASADYTTAADIYTDTITFTVTPSY